MPNWDDLIKLWSQIFGNQITFWLLRILGTVATIWLGLWLIAQIIEIWKKSIWPIFYNAEDKRRNFRRKSFAQHLENEINIINSQENWKDYRFAELEAEVEAEGLHSITSIIPFFKREYKGLKRENSLSSALKSSKARLILLEGDPGSGKSVALRHVTLEIIQKAKRSRNNGDLLPVYVNLRGIKRAKNQLIDRDLIFHFILASLNRLNDRDVDMFLEDEFQNGLSEGTWLFIFDSFDEIPDILSAREVDSTIKKYAGAITDFLHGFNQCRGIVASRYFRGPGHVDWPRFSIVGLTTERQIKLIKKAKMRSVLEQSLIGQLATTHAEIQAMSTNPLFLSMLIDHIQSGHEFPENIFSVFETYITRRFEQDKERIEKRFHLKYQEVRNIAETVAFCMTADGELGLSPYRDNLKEAIERLNFSAIPELNKYLDSLEFIKIGRSELSERDGESKTFSFSHRRFQEYFATSFVLKAPNRVDASQLLTDARWRETAVVLCQTRPIFDLESVISVAGEMLYKYALEIEEWRNSIGDSDEIESASLPWQSGLFYLLSLLQDGFLHRRYELPDYIRNNAGFILEVVQSYGILPYKKWSLEVAGIASQEKLEETLRNSLRHGSILLRSIAYQQISKLEQIPEDIAIWVRKSLIDKAATFQLFRERFSTQVFLWRLSDKKNFLVLFRILLILPFLDLFFHIGFALIVVFSINKILIAHDTFAYIMAALLLLMISVFLPLMSYLFTYSITKTRRTLYLSINFIVPLVFRVFMLIFAVLVEKEIYWNLILIIGGYLFLIPPSTIMLLQENAVWKNDWGILTSPIRASVFFVKSLALGLKSVGSQVSENIASFGIKKSLFVSVGILAFLGLVSALFSAVNWLSSKYPFWIFWVMIPTFILMVPILPSLLASEIAEAKERKLYRQTREKIDKDERQRYQRWRQNQSNKVTGDEFLKMLFEYKTPKFTYMFVKDITQIDVLEKNAQSKQAIKLAIQYLETKDKELEQVKVIDDLCILLERFQDSSED